MKAALEMVRIFRDGLAELQADPDPALGRHTQWLGWSEVAGLELRRVFADERLSAALREAGAHARMFSLGPAAVIELFEEWTWRLDEVIRELERLQAFAAIPGHVVVPDTSALVEGPIFDTFDWHSLGGLEPAEPVRVVVPILVVEEPDRLKIGKGNTRVRSVLKKLWDLHGDASAEPAPMPQAKPGPATIEVWLDEPWHARLPVADAEIIARASGFATLMGKQVVLASGDTSQLYRASAADLAPALMLKPAPEDQALGQPT